MARLDSMAAIDAALQPQQPTESITTPAVQTTELLTPPEVGRKEAKGKEKANEDAGIEQERAELIESENPSAINNISRIVKRTGVGIERIPAPGSLIFPLVILLVFFFLLLPVNGHTRFVWIWLVMTGNAEIQQSGGSGSGSDTTPAPAQRGTQDQAPNGFSMIPLANAIQMMTGVEDL